MALLDTGLFEYGKSIKFKTESIKINMASPGIEDIKSGQIENFEEVNTPEIVEKDENLENGDTPAEEEHGLGDPIYDDEVSNNILDKSIESVGDEIQETPPIEEVKHLPKTIELPKVKHLPKTIDLGDKLLTKQIGNDPLVAKINTPHKLISTTNWDEQAKADCESKVKAGFTFTYSNHPTNMGLTNNWACRESPDQTVTVEETPTPTTTTPKRKSGGGGGGGGGGGKSNMAKIDKLWAKRLKKKGVKTETGPTEAEREMESNPLGYILKYALGSAVVLGGGFFAYKQEYHTKAIKKIKSLRKK